MSCHLRIASDKAKFGQPEVKLGIVPGYGGSQRLPRLVGKGRALELLLTGDMIDAAEAYRIGLVNRVVSLDVLIETSRGILSTIIANGPLAVAHCVEAVDRGLDMSLDDAIALEASYFGLLSASADKQEGMRAFLDKRAATFTGV
jgi:enoyl-CoA hydratase